MRTHLSILLDAAPPMLKEIITAAAAADPYVDLQDSASLRSADAAGAHFDVVLSACPDPNDRTNALSLLSRWLATGVVLISPSGRQAVMYELSATPLCARDLSAAELLSAIRLKFSTGGAPM